jgi:hypothetical protein
LSLNLSLRPSSCLHLSASIPCCVFPLSSLLPSLSCSLSQGPAGLPGIPGIDGVRGPPGTVIMMPVRRRYSGTALGTGVLTREGAVLGAVLTSAFSLVPAC